MPTAAQSYFGSFRYARIPGADKSILIKVNFPARPFQHFLLRRPIQNKPGARGARGGAGIGAEERRGIR